MGFDAEPTGYEKTVLSDLQGAWQGLRRAVAEHAGFPGWERLLAHIDEAMSWESVRDLRQMRRMLLLIGNIATQNEVPEDVAFWVDQVREALDDTFLALKEGEIR